MCLDTPVLCTYHHHNVTSLILELPNAFSQGTLKYKRDTGVMIPHYKKIYVSRDVRFIEDAPYYSATG